MNTQNRLVFSLFFAVIACSFDMQAMHVPAVSKKHKINSISNEKATVIICSNLLSLIYSLHNWSHAKETSISIKDFQAVNLGAIFRRIILICRAHNVSKDSVLEKFKITTIDKSETLYTLLFKCNQPIYRDVTTEEQDKVVKQYIEDIYNFPILLRPIFKETTAQNTLYLADIGNTTEDILIDQFIHAIRSNDNNIINSLDRLTEFNQQNLVNKLDPTGFSLLHYAVFFDNIPVVAKLLEMEANLNTNHDMSVFSLIRSSQMHALLNEHLMKLNTTKTSLSEVQQLGLAIASLKQPKESKEKKQNQQLTTPTASTAVKSTADQTATVPAQLATTAAAAPAQSIKDNTKEKKDSSSCEYEVDPDFEFFVISSALNGSIKAMNETLKTNKVLKTVLEEDNYNTLLHLIKWYQKKKYSLDQVYLDFNKKFVGSKSLLELVNGIRSPFFSESPMKFIKNGYQNSIEFNSSVESSYLYLLSNLIKGGFVPQFKKWLTIALKNKMPLDFCVPNQFPLLMTAVLYNQYQIVEFLLANKASANQRVQGICPLLLAQSHEIQQLLLDAKADINHKDENEETPLIAAAKNANENQLAALLDYKTIPNLQKNEQLCDVKVDINEVDSIGRTALHWFVKNMQIDEESLGMLKKLILNGANCGIQNKNGVTPLMIAATKKNWQALQLMIQHAHVNPNDLSKHNNQGQTVVTIMNAQLNDIPEYLKKDPRVVKKQSLFKMLCEQGASVNTPDANGFTPLMTAAKVGNLKQVRLLLECKADPNVKHKVFYKTATDFAKDQFAETKNSTFMTIIGALNGATLYDITGKGVAEVTNLVRGLKIAGNVVKTKERKKTAETEVWYSPLTPERLNKRKEIEERLSKLKADKEKAKLERIQKELEEKKKQEEAQKEAQAQAELQARKDQEEENKKQAEQQSAAEQTSQLKDDTPSPTDKQQAKKNRAKKKSKSSKYAYTKDIDQASPISPEAKEEPVKKEPSLVDSMCPHPKKCKLYLETRFKAGQAAVELAQDAYQKHKDNKNLFATCMQSRFNKFLLPVHKSSLELNGYLEHLEDKTTCKSCTLDKQKIKEYITELARIQNEEQHSLGQCKQKKMVSYA